MSTIVASTPLSASVKDEDASVAAAAASMSTSIDAATLWQQGFPPFILSDKQAMFAAAPPALDFSSHMGGFYPHAQRYGGAPDPFAAMDTKAWSAATGAAGNPVDAYAFANQAAATFQQLHPYDPYPTTSMASGAGGYKVEPSAANAQYYGMIAAPYAAEYWKKSSSSSTPASTSSSSSTFSSLSLRAAATKPETPQNLPYRTGPGTNNVRVRTQDKYRMVYSDYIRLELEKEFHMSEFITADRKADLAAKLNLTERQIKIWFQNRRAKKRRDEKTKGGMPMGMMVM